MTLHATVQNVGNFGTNVCTMMKHIHAQNVGYKDIEIDEIDIYSMEDDVLED